MLPGRSPALLAKSWATLDVLSGGRALPAFGLGIAHPVEQQAFGVARGDRAAIFDEALPLIRRLWSEDSVDHDGAHFHYEGMTRAAASRRSRLDVWLGGKAPSELRRVGRLADGWLASFSTPEDCKASRVAIEDAAAAAGRAIDDDHFGAMVFYSHDELPERLVELLASRNPGADPTRPRRARLAAAARAVRALRRRRLLEARARAVHRARRLGRRARARRARRSCRSRTEHAAQPGCTPSAAKRSRSSCT